MTLQMVDLSSNNPWPNAYAEAADVDILMVKATEGTGYVNAAGGAACDKVVQWAKANGRLWGFYHNARLPQQPEAEAQYFYDNCKNYFSHGVPAVDIEVGQGFLPYVPDDYALRFAKKLHALSGVWPLIYTSASLIAHSAAAAPYCGLWAAQYNTSFTDPLHGWKALTGWQYTNSPYDTSHVYTDRAGWQRIAAGSGTPDKVPTAPARKSVAQLAGEVLDKKWGDGADRRNRLTAAGYDYAAVQAEVNRRLGVTAKASVEDVAHQIVYGPNKWGNEPQRSANLRAAGYDPAAVQSAVNRLMGHGGGSGQRSQVVKSDDTLSGITGVKDWAALCRIARANGIADPNKIYPGQTIRW